MDASRLSPHAIRHFLGRMASYAFLILFSLGNLIPFAWMILSSVKDNQEIFMNSFGFPRIWRFQNFVDAWTQASIGSFFMNTVIVSIISVAGVVLLASMLAYILARVWPSIIMFSVFTLGIMLPAHTVLIPQFIIIRNLGIQNSLASLILIYIAVNLSLSFFIMHGFIKGIPREFEEAASIDGCSRYRTFFQIVFPICKPGIATIGVLAFLACWNQYLIPLVMMNKRNNRLLPQGIASLKGMFTIEYGVMSAAILIATIPVVIVYILFQEQVIKGMTAGAVKG